MLTHQEHQQRNQPNLLDYNCNKRLFLQPCSKKLIHILERGCQSKLKYRYFGICHNQIVPCSWKSFDCWCKAYHTSLVYQTVSLTVETRSLTFFGETWLTLSVQVAKIKFRPKSRALWWNDHTMDNDRPWRDRWYWSQPKCGCFNATEFILRFLYRLRANHTSIYK